MAAEIPATLNPLNPNHRAGPKNFLAEDLWRFAVFGLPWNFGAPDNLETGSSPDVSGHKTPK